MYGVELVEGSFPYHQAFQTEVGELQHGLQPILNLNGLLRPLTVCSLDVWTTINIRPSQHEQWPRMMGGVFLHMVRAPGWATGRMDKQKGLDSFLCVQGGERFVPSPLYENPQG